MILLALILAMSQSLALEPIRARDIGQRPVGGIDMEQSGQVLQWASTGEADGVCDHGTDADGHVWVAPCGGDIDRVVFHGLLVEDRENVWALEFRVDPSRSARVRDHKRSPRAQGPDVAASADTRWVATDRPDLYVAYGPDQALSYWWVRDARAWVEGLELVTAAAEAAPMIQMLHEGRFDELDAALGSNELRFRQATLDAIHREVQHQAANLDSLPLADAMHLTMGLKRADRRWISHSVEIEERGITMAVGDRLLERFIEEGSSLPPATAYGMAYLLVMELPVSLEREDARHAAGWQARRAACEAFAGRYELAPASGVDPRTLPYGRLCDRPSAVEIRGSEPSFQAERVGTDQSTYRKRVETRQVIQPDSLPIWTRRADELAARLQTWRDELGGSVTEQVEITAGSSRTYNEQRYGCSGYYCGTQVWEVTERTASTYQNVSYDPCALEVRSVSEHERYRPPPWTSVTWHFEEVPVTTEVWTGRMTDDFIVAVGEAEHAVSIEVNVEGTSRADAERSARAAFAAERVRHLEQALRERIELDTTALGDGRDAEIERRWRLAMFLGDRAPYSRDSDGIGSSTE